MNLDLEAGPADAPPPPDDVVAAPGAMTGTALISTMVALLQQYGVDHIEFDHHEPGSDEIVRLRVILMSPKPRRVS